MTFEQWKLEYLSLCCYPNVWPDDKLLIAYRQQYSIYYLASENDKRYAFLEDSRQPQEDIICTFTVRPKESRPFVVIEDCLA